jgi:hypothetical protein
MTQKKFDVKYAQIAQGPYSQQQLAHMISAGGDI